MEDQCDHIFIDQLNVDMEKKIKALVAACVNKLFMTLWQRRNFYEDEIKK